MAVETNGTFEYAVLKLGTHKKLEQALNDRAKSGWEPTLCSIWGTEVQGTHFVVLRRAVPASDGGADTSALPRGRRGPSEQAQSLVLRIGITDEQRDRFREPPGAAADRRE